HRDRVWTQLGIEPLHQAKGVEVLFDVDMRAHGDRMDARIGTSRRMHGDVLAGDRLRRLLERLLHARPMRLPLQAHERSAVAFESEGEAGHAPSFVIPAKAGTQGGVSAARASVFAGFPLSRE